MGEAQKCAAVTADNKRRRVDVGYFHQVVVVAGELLLPGNAGIGGREDDA